MDRHLQLDDDVLRPLDALDHANDGLVGLLLQKEVSQIGSFHPGPYRTGRHDFQLPGVMFLRIVSASHGEQVGWDNDVRRER